MKIICLDYDGSYTEFPELFDMIISESIGNNYKVIMTTMRYKEEADEVLKKLENRIDVYYTGRKAKGKYLLDLGIHVDLYIDDKPFWIYQDVLG